MDRTAISGATRFVAVMGRPVTHSLSPLIHNAAFAALGLDWICVACDVAPEHCGDAVRGIRALGIAGMSVTMPHKHTVLAQLDELSPDAARLEAVNCIVNDGGRLVGLNTDGDGFVAALRADLGLSPQGLRCAVIGAGGAARSVILALSRHGASRVAVINRTVANAQVAAALSPESFVGSESDITTADLVVNATSLGMAGTNASGEGQVHPCDPALLHSGQAVVDLIYNPLRTSWLDAAVAAGAVGANGISMLVHQAAVAFTAWTGLAAPVEAMNRAVGEHLAVVAGSGPDGEKS